MLVLSRRKNERIFLTLEDGREISVRVVEIRGDKVRLGWEAPESIKVHREEVHRKIKEAEAAKAEAA